MHDREKQEINGVWQELYQTAVASEVSQETAFGKECTALLRESYAKLFTAISTQESLSINPLIDTIAAIAQEKKKAQLIPPAYDLCEHAETSDFYEFLCEKGIISDHDPFDTADHPIAFSDYVDQRNALQREYVSECTKYGTPKSEAEKTLAEFDRYFKIQLIDEHFDVASRDSLQKWMERNKDERVTSEPKQTVEATGATRSETITAPSLKNLHGFSPN